MGRLSFTAATVIAGSPAYAVVSRHRAVDSYDLAYARQCRERGWGWQAIAQQLRICETDLRVAMGDLPAGPVEKTARARPYRKADRPLREAILLAAAEGAKDVHQVAAALDAAVPSVAAIATSLRRMGLLNRRWSLTPEGQAAADRLIAAEVADA